MDVLFSSANIDVRIMDYDDVPLTSKVYNDESESNIVYLRKQLENKKARIVLAFL